MTNPATHDPVVSPVNGPALPAAALGAVKVITPPWALAYPPVTFETQPADAGLVSVVVSECQKKISRSPVLPAGYGNDAEAVVCAPIPTKARGASPPARSAGRRQQ